MEHVTTREYLSNLRKLGFKYDVQNKSRCITIFYLFTTGNGYNSISIVSQVRTDRWGAMDTIFPSFEDLSQEKKEALVDATIQYICTPIESR